jgi:signal transduction histidine kinase
VRVRLAFGADRLEVSVSDDGVGCSPDEAARVRPGHYGLQGMRERLQPFAGSVTLESAPGRGMTVRLAVPRAAPTERPPA